MVTRAEINEAIKTRMDLVEEMLNRNAHLAEPEAFEEALAAAVKYWSAMDEGDREFYEAASWAFEEKKQWAK